MITKSQQFLLEAIKASLFDIEIQYPSDIDWDIVMSEANNQTVLGLVSPAIPFRVEASDHAKSTYMRIMFEQDKLIKSFNVAEIPCVIIKGSAAAINYPKPYLRAMGDIDVLVPRDKFNEALELLESTGYIYEHGKIQDKNFPDDTRELKYIKNGILVEIHQSFSSPGVEVDEILNKAIFRRTYCELNGYTFPMLPTPENGLVLLGHINQHLQNNMLGLRQVIDWEMYVHSVSDIDSWMIQLVPIIERIGLLTLAAYVTRMCNRHLGLSVNIAFGVDVDDSLVDELLEVVLTDGNFGRRINADISKDEQKIISASYGIRRYGFGGYFTRVGLGSINSSEKSTYPIIIAFIYGVFKQLRKGVKSLLKDKSIGKKIIRSKMMYNTNSKRNELFKKLGVRTGNE